MAKSNTKRRPTIKMKPKKRIVIFSSTENLPLAKAIQANLYTGTYSTKVWTDGFFKFSQSYISNFQDIQYEYDFALVLCGADDVLTSRGKRRKTTRDNVFLELGMCISSFGLKRVLIIKHKDVKLPSDLDGISPIDYSITEEEDIDAVAGTICSKVGQYISREEYPKKQYVKLSWNEYFRSLKKLTERLSQSIPLGGYEYDAIVGINRGGLMAADMIAREVSPNAPVISLYAERKTGVTCFDAEHAPVKNTDLLKAIEGPSIRNILLIDSFTRDGISVIEAKAYLQRLFPEKTIKSAVVYANKRLQDKASPALADIDYVGEYKYLDGKKLSLD